VAIASYVDARETLQKGVSWLGYHLAIYAGVAGATAVLFLAGAAGYSYLWPADVISIENTPPAGNGVQPLNGGQAVPSDFAPKLSIPHLQPGDALVAGLSNPLDTGNLIGLEVWDSDRARIGTITDLVLDHHGNAHGIIVGLNGYWLTKKYVVIPFGQFSWDYEPSDQNPNAFVVARAKVPYNLEHLQGLPPIGDPWVPLNRPAAPGSE
jgi:PRC-barrel domain